MGRVQSIIKKWELSVSNMRCKEVCSDLEHLGFSIRSPKSKPGHKVVSHKDLQNFYGTNFNCGHGENPIILKIYIKKLINLLISLQDELDEIF